MSAGAEAAWEAVIGLEVHVQLATRTKLFSAAPVAAGGEPNTRIDPYTLGLPGVLPVLNRRAVDLALRVGLAFDCEIARTSAFARKHYFYPDLPKGYQITQYDEPLGRGGAVSAYVDGELRRFPLTRIHLEEDAGKSLHDPAGGPTRVDYNRAGVPLVEIVGEPALRSAAEAEAYLRALHAVVVRVGACEGNLEEGNLRCDANISVRRAGTGATGERVELKNINSFRFVRRGIEHEIARQVALREAGGQVLAETRLWDDAAGVTRPMRSKEGAPDYRYFPEPDLPPLVVDEPWIARVRGALPEPPHEVIGRFRRDYGLSYEDAELLARSAAGAAYFEQVARSCADPALAANWIRGELSGALNRQGRSLDDCPVPAAHLARLLGMLRGGEVSGKMAKACLASMVERGEAPEAWLAHHGGQITDAGSIEQAVRRVLGAHPDEVEACRAGKTGLAAFFVGKVMQASRGRANPRLVSEAVRRLLDETEEGS